MKNKKVLIGIIISYIIMVLLTSLALIGIRSSDQFFFHLATAIILNWIVLLIGYYIWAIFFYNINMGWTDDDWDSLEQRKQEGDKNRIAEEEPTVNPHANETLGLPPGTIRGTIALSLLVTGLAMVIASFELNSTYKSNATFIDNFEFFKTAFLMMIAFYFGNKSLEALNGRNKGHKNPTKKNSYSMDESGSNSAYQQTNNTKATTLKNILQDESTTTPSDSNMGFDDKESVG